MWLLWTSMWCVGWLGSRFVGLARCYFSVGFMMQIVKAALDSDSTDWDILFKQTPTRWLNRVKILENRRPIVFALKLVSDDDFTFRSSWCLCWLECHQRFQWSEELCFISHSHIWRIFQYVELIIAPSPQLLNNPVIWRKADWTHWIVTCLRHGTSWAKKSFQFLDLSYDSAWAAQLSTSMFSFFFLFTLLYLTVFFSLFSSCCCSYDFAAELQMVSESYVICIFFSCNSHPLLLFPPT